MKKLLLACSLIGIAAIANAQPAPDQPGSHHAHEHTFDAAERAAHLQKTLQLSDDQTAKVKQVLANSEQQRKAIDDKYKPQFEAFRSDMKNLHEQTHTQLNGILTPKQQQALEEQMKTRDKFMHHHHDKDDVAKH